MHQVIQNIRTGKREIQSIPMPTVGAGDLADHGVNCSSVGDVQRHRMDIPADAASHRSGIRPDAVGQDHGCTHSGERPHAGSTDPRGRPAPGDQRYLAFK